LWDENTNFWEEYKMIDKSLNDFPDDIFEEFKADFHKKHGMNCLNLIIYF